MIINMIMHTTFVGVSTFEHQLIGDLSKSCVRVGVLLIVNI